MSRMNNMKARIFIEVEHSIVDNSMPNDTPNGYLAMHYYKYIWIKCFAIYLAFLMWLQTITLFN